jgi:hypothetical protein
MQDLLLDQCTRHSSYKVQRFSPQSSSLNRGVIQAVMLVTCIAEVSDFNLGPGLLTDICPGHFQSRQTIGVTDLAIGRDGLLHNPLKFQYTEFDYPVFIYLWFIYRRSQ